MMAVILSVIMAVVSGNVRLIPVSVRWLKVTAMMNRVAEIVVIDSYNTPSQENQSQTKHGHWLFAQSHVELNNFSLILPKLVPTLG